MDPTQISCRVFFPTVFFFRAGFFLASVLTVFFVYVSLSSVLVYLPHV